MKSMNFSANCMLFFSVFTLSRVVFFRCIRGEVVGEGRSKSGTVSYHEFSIVLPKL
jgi:hypothetical protein